MTLIRWTVLAVWVAACGTGQMGPDGGTAGGSTAGGASTAGGTAGGASTAGGSAGGASTAGGTAGGASTAGGTAGGASTAGGSAGGESTAGGSAGGASTAGGTAGGESTAGGSAGGASTAGGSAGGDSTAGGSAGGDSTAGGSAGGASTAGGSAGGGSTAGGSAGGVSTAGGSAGGGSTAGGSAGGASTAGGSAGGVSTAGGSAGGGSTAGGSAGGASTAGGSAGGASTAGGSAGGVSAAGGSAGGASTAGGSASIVSGTIAIQAGQPFTNVTNVSLSITAASTGGTVTQMRLGNDGALGLAQPFMSTFPWTLANMDGTRSVTVQLIDSTGATVSTSDSIVLDRAPPMGAFIVTGGATFTNSTTVPLQLTYTDANAMTVRVQVDSGPFGAPVAYAAMLNATLPATDGLHDIGVQVTDAAGNVAIPMSRSVVLDRIAPQVIAVALLDTDSTTGTATNSRNPPMTASASDDQRLASVCAVVSLSGVVPPPPSASDTCWLAAGGGDMGILPVTPQFTSDEEVKRVTVFVRDAAGNIGRGFLEVTYDVTPPSSGALTLSEGDGGYREISGRLTFAVQPADATQIQVGINLANNADPASFIWSTAKGFVGVTRFAASVANDSVVSYAVRFADAAGNGGPMSNTLTNLRARAAFQPLFTLPTAEDLNFAHRIPMPGNGTRFLVHGGHDNTFTSDDFGVTWTKRDSWNRGAPVGMAVTSSGTVLALNSFARGNNNTYFDVSADLGVFFRPILFTRSFRPSGEFEKPTFIAPRSTGGNDFAMLDFFGKPAFASFDAQNRILELGSATSPSSSFSDIAGCVGLTYGGAVGIDGSRIFRSFDSARSFEEVPLPAGFPSTAILRDVEGSGANVVILAQRSAGVVTLLRETSCGSGAWAEVLGLNFPANRVAVALSVAGLNRAWVLSRSTTTEEVTISKVDFATSTAQHLAWTPQARLNDIAGDSANAVLVVGARGEIYSTSTFPSFASRRSRPVETFASLSVRDGTPVGSAVNGSAVVVGGINGRVSYSGNSGVAWVDDPPGAGVGTMLVDATHVSFNGIGALESNGRAWMNPQTGWQFGAFPQDASPYRNLSCARAACLFAGSFGAIARLTPSGTALLGTFERAPVLSSPIDWYDLDNVETASGTTFIAVGTNGISAVTSVRSPPTNTWGPVTVATTVTNATLKKVALQRDSTGASFAIAQNGTLWWSSSTGSSYVQLTGGFAGATDVASRGGGRFVVVGTNGWLREFVLPGSFETLYLPTSARIVGVEVSDADPNLVWVLAEDGAMFVSRVGLGSQ
jgi:hypothetical protein